ncbi:SDR family NAD(P)-dependent oxidoreductase [Amycolatopsis sp. YIM 10]|uniref:SDR family NAD(P)-dependent oxidoreductase n=1 Tax=Amycolatopsis sp. YIM 10 TaxID=2653857 RepID=UPI0012905553|nr:SDR family NAD(P)-dependent oxidoreductase [Amycolatopsis sp. YIM 10]QFU92515.1 Putative short-chain type dehydrogenase/reductase [Amycolatopsis sp. YIM 10]
MNPLTFDDRVVVITGAGRGIGRAHALLLAARGASVVVSDLGARVDGSDVDGDDPAGSVVEEIRAAGGTAVASRADVSTETGAAAVIDAAISEFGRLDAVVNNAGIVRTAHFDQISTAEYQRYLDVHFFGSLHVCRAAWPHLVESGAGRVVNTVSAAMLGNPLMTHYGSSKGAVFSLTRNLAIEGAEHGILVNALAPGAGTRMAENSADSLSPEVLQYLRTQLLPEHVAPVAAYLLHPSCAVTGEVFNVAGGAVSRMAVVTTTGIHDPALTVETVAERFDEVMAITPDAQPQAITAPQPHTT